VACRNEIEIVSGDIRDSHFCHEITREVDIVFHLAALIAIPYSYKAPESYIDTNVKGTLNICQAAMDNGVERIIHTSTSEVYGTARYVPIDEEHPLQPQSPYSASKIGADAIAMSFYNSYNLPLTIARPFNTYGPRQSARAIIPTIITQIAAGKKQIRLGDTRPTRDLNFVLDTCRGFIALARSERSIGEIVNIGSNTEISMGDLFYLISRLMGVEVSLVEDPQRFRPEKSEVLRLRCNNEKIKALTGFEPQYSLEEGLKLTIEWFVNPSNLAKYKTDIYNV
jgi:NAD dependent epimerase/dehydratase